MLRDHIQGSIKTGMDHLRGAMSDVAQEAPRKAGDTVGDAADLFESFVGQAKDRLGDVLVAAKDRTSGPLGDVHTAIAKAYDRRDDRLDEIKALVIKNPFVAVLAAAGFGIALGLYLKRTAR